MSQEREEGKSILLVVAEPRALLGTPRFRNYWGAFAEALGMGSDILQPISAIEEPLPVNVQQDGVIIGGSSASAYDELPWISNLEYFVKTLKAKRTPTLGVCFGHQIVARALGATVEKGPNGIEFGATTVTLADAGLQDPLYRGLSATVDVAMTHGDAVTSIPRRDEVVVLAGNDRYPYQSLAFGPNIRTVQFHPEMNRVELERIVTNMRVPLSEQGTVPADGFEAFIAQLRRTDIETPGKQILANFMNHFVAA